jgi:hypothetical protein
MSVTGDGRVNRRLRNLAKSGPHAVGQASAVTGRSMVRIAKALIPVDSGDTQDEIEMTQFRDGSVLVNFGQKAKVIEGGKGPHPYVNPTLKVERKRHRARVNRALKKALKVAFSG